MSEFHVVVVRLGPFVPHPNADTLDVTKVFDYTVVAKRGNFKEGDLAVYIPVDAVVPDTEDWYHLCPRDNEGNPRYPVGQVPEKYRIIEAKRLRGIFSQGCLHPLPDSSPNWQEGMHVQHALGIKKYDPPPPGISTGGLCESAPLGWKFIEYTDVEGQRKYPDVIQEGEEVVIVEKVHGANARYVHDGKRLWAGSHHQIKKNDSTSIWWKVASEMNLEEKLAAFPKHVFFGEVFGNVQDLKYGAPTSAHFRVFDVFDLTRMVYLDHDDAVTVAASCGLEWCPVLYRGPWRDELKNLAEGRTTVLINGKIAEHVREGYVVKPIYERYDDRVGRVILKRHGEGYLLRKRKK